MDTGEKEPQSLKDVGEGDSSSIPVHGSKLSIDARRRSVLYGIGVTLAKQFRNDHFQSQGTERS